MIDLLSFIKNNKFISLAGILLILCCIKYVSIFNKKHSPTINKNKNIDNHTQDAQFIPSKTFTGEKKGYVFKTNENKTGYYRDK